MRLSPTLVLLCGLGFSHASLADSTLEFRVAENGAESGKLQSVRIKDGKILLKGAGGGDLDLIYSAMPEQLSIIDHRKRTVMVLDENQVNRIVRQTETVQPLIRGFGEQVAKLNPEQRAKWEKILGGKVSLDAVAAAAAQPTSPSRIVKTGQKQKVASVACEQMGVFQGSKQTAEFCLANPSSLKLANTDYATLRAMLVFSERLVGKTQGLAKHFGLNLPNLDLQGLSGVPVEVSSVSDTPPKSLRLNRILASAIPAEIMQIPDGYQDEPFKLWK